MNEDVKHVIDELFKASEHVREALDTIDLCGIPWDGSLLVAIEQCGNFLESQAKFAQAHEKKKNANK